MATRGVHTKKKIVVETAIKHMEVPDLTAVKDFLRFYAATSKSKIVEIMTCDSRDSSPALVVSRTHRQMSTIEAKSTI